MIKPLNAPQLSAAKPRSGLQSISDLLPRLIQLYELQAEMARKRAELVEPVAVVQTGPTKQATFGWYE